MRGAAGVPNPFVGASFLRLGANGLKDAVDGAPNREGVAAGGLPNSASFLSTG